VSEIFLFEKLPKSSSPPLPSPRPPPQSSPLVCSSHPSLFLHLLFLFFKGARESPHAPQGAFHRLLHCFFLHFILHLFVDGSRASAPRGCCALASRVREEPPGGSCPVLKFSASLHKDYSTETHRGRETITEPWLNYFTGT